MPLDHANHPLAPPPISGTAAGAGRLAALDGIRGWAALAVVCFHMLWETFGGRFPIYRNLGTASLLDGNLAASVFFVLSGEALSNGFFAGGGTRLVADLALRRWPRLVIPIAATCLIVYMLERLGLCFNQAAGRIVDRPDWLGSWLATPASLLDTLGFALIGVFTTPSVTAVVDPFLWTMRLELLGSILVFVTLLALSITRWTWCVILPLTVMLPWLSGSYGLLACFLAGLLFARLRVAGMFARLHPWRAADWLALYTIAMLLLSNGVLHGFGHFDGRYPLLASALTLLIFASRTATHAMQARVSRALGRISYPLFLVQFPVIISLTSGLIVVLDRNHALDTGTAFIVAVLSVYVAVVAAILFRPVERASIRISRRWSQAARRRLRATQVSEPEA